MKNGAGLGIINVSRVIYLYWKHFLNPIHIRGERKIPVQRFIGGDEINL